MIVDILIVDDELAIRELITDILKQTGYNARCAANSCQTFELIEEKLPSLIILDIWLQKSKLDGLGILEVVKKKHPGIPVIVISGHGTIEIAVNAIKMGAYDYLEKPFQYDKLLLLIKNGLENARLRRENLDLRNKVIDKTEIIGNSPAITKVKLEVDKVAPTDGRIMVHGPTGSGKELISRLIHKKSKRNSGPFIVFSPSGLNAERIAQELFGDPEKRDVNGLNTKRTCALEAANNGTLYIDEVGDLPLTVQSKLLKFLQDNTIDKNINQKPVKLNVRIISATSRDLQYEINQNKFRQDLYYRLNVVPLKVPSLSERKDDIAMLAEYFIKQLAKFSGLKERRLTDDTIAVLQVYNWQGNIRQLRNVIEWTLIMNPVSNNEDNVIKADMLPAEIINNGLTIARPDTNLDMLSMPLREAREVFERQYLSAQMNKHNYNISKTSMFVGMERSALHRKLKTLKIPTSYCKNIDDEDFNFEDKNEMFINR